ncbi:hypothetical protein KY347_02310 [Candidatus Woesearchaeota archaeon]|nr:hypothetical protein [Candidatus Woesearchaeota archaeon]
MHFYESSIITTTDGLYCQVYGNEHPEGKILVKPKYVPTGKISSDDMPYRFISGRKMNRLNLWIEPEKLKIYISNFSRAYQHYIYKSIVHSDSPLFFAVPRDYIERVYSPREGLSDLMSMPKENLDEHLETVFELIKFLLESGIELNDLGITYSTLMGHYSPNISDINIVVYGKDKFWGLMKYLQDAKHKDLRWKTYDEWKQFYKKRNRHIIHKEEIYIENMYRKKSEGFFRKTLFIIFAVENADETWFKWGEEIYNRIGTAKFEGKATGNKNSVVRPGYYEVADSKFISGDEACKGMPIKKAVFYSRDYCMLAYPGEKIEFSGVVEEVVPKKGEKYYRLVIGYFDSYLCKRRDEEYIRVLEG